MCVMTSLGILGLLGWGAYSAGKSAWKHRSTISQFAVNVFNMPDKVYQAVTGKQKRTLRVMVQLDPPRERPSCNPPSLLATTS